MSDQQILYETIASKKLQPFHNSHGASQNFQYLYLYSIIHVSDIFTLEREIRISNPMK